MNEENEKEHTARELTEDYWCFVQNCWLTLDQPATFSFYGLDAERCRLHQQMCDVLGLTELETKCITDHINECKDFEDFYQKLLNFKKQKELN